MKKTLITMILFFTSVNLFSQNPLDPAKVFIKDTSSVINLIDTQFVKGFNWSSQGARLDSAMHINFYHHMDLDTSFHDYYPNARLMQPLEHPTRVIIGGRNNIRLFQGHSLYLDPTITVDSTLNFKPKPYDNTGSVFGFLNKSKVRILNSTQDTSKDYHFAMLDKDSITSGPEIVLSNIWKNNISLLFSLYFTS